MKTIGTFRLDGVPMQAVAADDGGIEAILATPLLAFASRRLKDAFDANPNHGDLVCDVQDFVPVSMETTQGPETWRLFLGTDGSGAVSVFADTGGKLDEGDIVGVEPMGVAANSRVWTKYRLPTPEMQVSQCEADKKEAV